MRKHLAAALFSGALLFLLTDWLIIRVGKPLLTEAMSDSEFISLCAEGSLDEITSALTSAADVNARSEYGAAVLLSAANLNRRSKTYAVSAITASGAYLDARNDYGTTALMAAARYNGDPWVITALVGFGADVGARDDNGATALMLAAGYNDNPEITAALIASGAKVNESDTTHIRHFNGEARGINSKNTAKSVFGE